MQLQHITVEFLSEPAHADTLRERIREVACRDEETVIDYRFGTSTTLDAGQDLQQTEHDFADWHPSLLSEEALDRNQKLIAFAESVLFKLSREREWGADTTDDIAAEAIREGLAGLDGEGYFSSEPGFTTGDEVANSL